MLSFLSRLLSLDSHAPGSSRRQSSRQQSSRRRSSQHQKNLDTVDAFLQKNGFEVVSKHESDFSGTYTFTFTDESLHENIIMTLHLSLDRHSPRAMGFRVTSSGTDRVMYADYICIDKYFLHRRKPQGAPSRSDIFASIDRLAEALGVRYTYLYDLHRYTKRRMRYGGYGGQYSLNSSYLYPFLQPSQRSFYEKIWPKSIRVSLDLLIELLRQTPVVREESVENITRLTQLRNQILSQCAKQLKAKEFFREVDQQKSVHQRLTQQYKKISNSQQQQFPTLRTPEIQRIISKCSEKKIQQENPTNQSLLRTMLDPEYWKTHHFIVRFYI